MALCVFILWLKLFVATSWLLLCFPLMLCALCLHLMVTTVYMLSCHCYCVCCHSYWCVCVAISWLLLCVLPVHDYCCLLPIHGYHCVCVAEMGRQLPSRSSRMWRNTARQPSWKSMSLRNCEKRTPQANSQYYILFSLSVRHTFPVSVWHTFSGSE